MTRLASRRKMPTPRKRLAKAGYEKNGKFFKALLSHKTKEGTKARQNNGGQMPNSWYPDATKALKMNPG